MTDRIGTAMNNARLARAREVERPLNRVERRHAARVRVKRGGGGAWLRAKCERHGADAKVHVTEGEVARTGRALFAQSLKTAMPTPEERAEELGLEIAKPKIWTPRGLIGRAREVFA